MMTRREMMGRTMLTAIAAAAAGSALKADAAPARQFQQHPMDTPPIKSLMREPLAPSIKSPIVDVITLEMGPGEASGPHQHTGQVFAYILEGEIENQVEPNPPKRYGPGDYFYEPPMHEHKMMRNLSNAKPAKLLICQIEQKGKPFTIPWPSSRAHS